MSIAKVEHTKKARKDQGKCGRCATPLPVGSEYRYWASFRGPKHVRCMAPGCTPRQSELESSKLSAIYASVEEAESSLAHFDATDDIEDIKEGIAMIVREVGSTVQEVADEYREAAADDNGNIFNPDMDERASTLESSASELDSWEPTLDDPDDETDLHDWLEALKEEAQEAIQNIDW